MFQSPHAPEHHCRCTCGDGASTSIIKPTLFTLAAHTAEYEVRMIADHISTFFFNKSNFLRGSSMSFTVDTYMTGVGGRRTTKNEIKSWASGETETQKKTKKRCFFVFLSPYKGKEVRSFRFPYVFFFTAAKKPTPAMKETIQQTSTHLAVLLRRGTGGSRRTVLSRRRRGASARGRHTVPTGRGLLRVTPSGGRVHGPRRRCRRR